jgi:hypothetical protein
MDTTLNTRMKKGAKERMIYVAGRNSSLWYAMDTALEKRGK